MDETDLYLFYRVMESVETTVKKRLNRQFLARVLGSQSDASDIEDCRALLKDALDKFTVSPS
jgi:hypothetical protein